jgi:hypothetical protein
MATKTRFHSKELTHNYRRIAADNIQQQRSYGVFHTVHARVK